MRRRGQMLVGEPDRKAVGLDAQCVSEDKSLKERVLLEDDPFGSCISLVVSLDVGVRAKLFEYGMVAFCVPGL